MTRKELISRKGNISVLYFSKQISIGRTNFFANIQNHKSLVRGFRAVRVVRVALSPISQSAWSA